MRRAEIENLTKIAVSTRDAEWTRVVLGVTAKVLTPAEAAKWLANDHIERARNVTEARPRRGPVHW